MLTIGRCDRLARTGEVVSIKLANNKFVQAKVVSTLTNLTPVVGRDEAGNWYAWGHGTTIVSQVKSARRSQPKKKAIALYPFMVGSQVYPGFWQSGYNNKKFLIEGNQSSQLIGFANLGDGKSIAFIEVGEEIKKIDNGIITITGNNLIWVGGKEVRSDRALLKTINFTSTTEGEGEEKALYITGSGTFKNQVNRVNKQTADNYIKEDSQKINKSIVLSGFSANSSPHIVKHFTASRNNNTETFNTDYLQTVNVSVNNLQKEEGIRQIDYQVNDIIYSVNVNYKNIVEEVRSLSYKLKFKLLVKFSNYYDDYKYISSVIGCLEFFGTEISDSPSLNNGNYNNGLPITSFKESVSLKSEVKEKWDLTVPIIDTINEEIKYKNNYLKTLNFNRDSEVNQIKKIVSSNFFRNGYPRKFYLRSDRTEFLESDAEETRLNINILGDNSCWYSIIKSKNYKKIETTYSNYDLYLFLWYRGSIDTYYNTNVGFEDLLDSGESWSDPYNLLANGNYLLLYKGALAPQFNPKAEYYQQFSPVLYGFESRTIPPRWENEGIYAEFYNQSRENSIRDTIATFKSLNGNTTQTDSYFVLNGEKKEVDSSNSWVFVINGEVNDSIDKDAIAYYRIYKDDISYFDYPKEFKYTYKERQGEIWWYWQKIQDNLEGVIRTQWGNIWENNKNLSGKAFYMEGEKGYFRNVEIAIAWADTVFKFYDKIEYRKREIISLSLTFTGEPEEVSFFCYQNLFKRYIQSGLKVLPLSGLQAKITAGSAFLDDLVEFEESTIALLPNTKQFICIDNGGIISSVRERGEVIAIADTSSKINIPDRWRLIGEPTSDAKLQVKVRHPQTLRTGEEATVNASQMRVYIRKFEEPLSPKIYYWDVAVEGIEQTFVLDGEPTATDIEFEEELTGDGLFESPTVRGLNFISSNGGFFKGDRIYYIAIAYKYSNTLSDISYQGLNRIKQFVLWSEDNCFHLLDYYLNRDKKHVNLIEDKLYIAQSLTVDEARMGVKRGWCDRFSLQENICKHDKLISAPISGLGKDILKSDFISYYK